MASDAACAFCQDIANSGEISPRHTVAHRTSRREIFPPHTDLRGRLGLRLLVIVSAFCRVSRPLLPSLYLVIPAPMFLSVSSIRERSDQHLRRSSRVKNGCRLFMCLHRRTRQMIAIIQLIRSVLLTFCDPGFCLYGWSCGVRQKVHRCHTR